MADTGKVVIITVEGAGGVLQPAEKLVETAESAKLDVTQSLPPQIEQCSLATPKISVEPRFRDFGVFHLGVTTEKICEIVLKNIGAVPLTIAPILLEGETADIVITGPALKGIKLEGGVPTTLHVACLPLSLGKKRVVFEVASDATNVTGAIPVIVTVQSGKPVIDCKPSLWDYKDLAVKKDEGSAIFTITNSGTAPLQLDDLEVSGHREDFSYPSFKGRILRPMFQFPEDKFELKIVAKTTAPGKRQATATILSDAENGPVALSLTATGTQPQISVEPRSLDFGTFHRGVTPEKTDGITLTNIGDAPLTIEPISLKGDTKDIVITGKSLKGIRLGVKDSDKLSVACLPQSVGKKRVEFVVVSDAANVSGSIPVSVTALAGEPIIDLKPPSWDYKNLVLKKDEGIGKFEITNTGTLPLTLGALEIRGDRDDFSWPTLKGSVLRPISEFPEDKAKFEIRAKPTAIGKRRATAKILSDAANGPISLSVEANGTQPEIAVDLPGHDFGRLIQGVELKRTFQITNPGTAPLTINSLALNDETHYAITSKKVETVVLKPLKEDKKAILLVEVTAKPGAGEIAGVKLDGNITIDSDAVNVLKPLTLTTTAILPTVSIDQAPYVAVSYRAKSREKQLRAKGLPAGLGEYLWSISDTEKVQFKGNPNPRIANPTAVGKATGTAKISVRYKIGNVESGPATIDFHVVDITITEPSPLRLDYSGDPILPLAVVHSVGVPADGTVEWQPITTNAVKYGAGKSKVTNLNAEVEPVHRGTPSATVKYTYPTDGRGVTVEAKIDFDVRLLRCSNVNWAPAGATRTSHTARVLCTHDTSTAVYQRPQSPAHNTATPAHPHHHGETCDYCKVDGQAVYHFLTPDTGTDAVTELLEFRNQIHTLRGHFPDDWIDGVNDVPDDATDYIDEHPWLANVPVWLYDPAGYTPPCAACKASGTCSNCRGTPSQVCGKCSGDGTFEGNCNNCGGAKTLNCGRCRGSGTYTKQCRYCTGAGCKGCKWTGKFTANCGECNGRKKLTCTVCRGAGTLVYNCNQCGTTGTWVCNLCTTGACKYCRGTGWQAQESNGKMIGVVIGKDSNGCRHLLRGASGTFPGGHAAAKGLPNAYWARTLQHNYKIYSASHDVKPYPAYDKAKTQFGRCAAARMLTYALHLGLEIESMAEMWLGATKGGGHVDGQLVASCEFCRVYLHHMLCDRGTIDRGRPYPGDANTPPNHGLLIRIAEEPAVGMDATSTVALTLNGVAEPASPTATYAWTITNTGVANYVGARNGAALQVEAVAAGTTTAKVVYTLGAQRKTAEVEIHVVDLKFNVTPPLQVPRTLSTGTVLQAIASPGGGKYRWSLGTPGIVKFAEGADPGNIASVTVQPIRPGNTDVIVEYILGGPITRRIKVVVS